MSPREARLTIAILTLALWGVIAALYEERHPPAGAGGWAILVAASGGAALFLLAVALGLARTLARIAGR